MAAGRFDVKNWRHREILDASEQLEGDPELEEARRIAAVHRRMHFRREAPHSLREFARLVAERRPEGSRRRI